mgnify:CR=1 FL=1
MGVDLLRQDKRWKEGLMDIRHIMADLVQKVCISQFCWTIFFVFIYTPQLVAPLVSQTFLLPS